MMDIRTRTGPVNVVSRRSNKGNNVLILITTLGVIETHNDINAANPGALGGGRQVGNDDPVTRDILDPAGPLKEEMMVFAGIGVEVGPAGIDSDLAQKTGLHKLMQRIVDRRQRYLD